MLDHVREALFNILFDKIEGARVLDAFAGTGLLGLESLSRGAKDVVFVERDRTTAGLLKALLEAWKLAGNGRVIVGDYFTVEAQLIRSGPFDLVFIDPPYREMVVERALRFLMENQLVSPRGIVVVKHHPKNAPSIPRGWSAVDVRRYGDTVLTFFGPPGEMKGKND